MENTAEGSTWPWKESVMISLHKYCLDVADIALWKKYSFARGRSGRNMTALLPHHVVVTFTLFIIFLVSVEFFHCFGIKAITIALQGVPSSTIPFQRF